ncbi:MAG: NIPSNAP family protein [Pirellulaceae bacterium]
MKRRDFMAAAGTAGLASVATSIAPARGEASTSDGKEYFELRRYRIESDAQQQQVTKFYGDVAIPAFNRAGIKPVGVFSPTEDDSKDLFVLLPHSCPVTLITARHALSADEAYLKAGESFLNAPPEEPGFARIESSLLRAFDKMPKMELPTKAETRIFQLRIYESHSPDAARRKIDMFNAGGEIALFHHVGLTPVFFGEALIGTKLPNLTYMLGFDNREAGEAAWKKFLADPEWTKLKAVEEYKKTVSNITNIYLKPAACSQI